MDDAAFSRRTVLIACDVLKGLGHAGFQRLALEFELPEAAVEGATLKQRAVSLASYLIGNSTVPYVIGGRAAFVERAARATSRPSMYASADDISEFLYSLRADGFIVDGNGEIRPSTESEGPTNDEIQGSTGSMPPNKTFSPQTAAEDATLKEGSRRIFIVHGHDEAMRDKVASELYKAKCEPVILGEQVNSGQTIIEKIEKHGDVAFAVVLLSPDDVGALKGDEVQPRARQNVLLELGYFFGRIGRSKLAVLRKGAVEFPSDFAGVVARV